MVNKRQEANLVRLIEALVSDNFRQLKTKNFDGGQLYDPKKRCYCALGVAASIMEVPKFGKWFFFPSLVLHGEAPVTSLFTPDYWFAKTFGEGIIPAQLAHMSDDGTTFKQIALYLCSYLTNNSEHTNSFVEKILRLATEERLRTQSPTTVFPNSPGPIPAE